MTFTPDQRQPEPAPAQDRHQDSLALVKPGRRAQYARARKARLAHDGIDGMTDLELLDDLERRFDEMGVRRG